MQPQNSPNKIATYTLPDGRKITGKWKCSEKTFKEYIKNDLLVFSENGQPNKKIFLSQNEGQLADSLFIDVGTNEVATKEIKALFACHAERSEASQNTESTRGLHKDISLSLNMTNSQKDFSPVSQAQNDKMAESQNDNTTLFATPKPEALIKRIIEISTNENDLVMDFFAGSGTTLAVAMKMKRRFVGIEQMDYIESITKERLKKVVAGEQGGISKAVDWQGGGSFIYAEMAELNLQFKNLIEDSQSDEELCELYETLRKLAFIDYRVNILQKLENKEFGILSLQEKKEILKMCLDSNMDYILLADINDSSFEFDDETKRLNEIFYRGVK